MTQANKVKRRPTTQVKVGHIFIGSQHPINIQSMTNTDTSDVQKTYEQIKSLYQAGSEIVRITVDTPQSAQSVAKIKELLIKNNINCPLVGCFHYNGHQLLKDFPQLAQSLDKYRINPGNVGFGKKRDKQFEQIIQIAIKYNKPVRIGVNWGSLDQNIIAQLMDENNKLKNPKSATQIMHKSLVKSCLDSAKLAEKIGLQSNQIILSAKTSRLPDLVAVYQDLAQKCNYPLHLGLTEAGMGIKGITATSAALAILLEKGIGDTIRASLTPKPNEARENEVILCKELLQNMGFRYFTPQVSACPGCGRTTSTFFQELALKIQHHIQENMPIWKNKYQGVEKLNIAVMGCIVNGPGESKHADIGISLPGTGESPSAPVFCDGKKTHTLKGNNIATQFTEILENYIENRFSK